MQVPPAWLSAFGRNLAEAFDPCTNIAVGTAKLSQFDFECAAHRIPMASPKKASEAHGVLPTGASAGAAHPASAAHRLCVLRRYEGAIGLPDFAAVTTLENPPPAAHPCAGRGGPHLRPRDPRGRGGRFAARSDGALRAVCFGFESVVVAYRRSSRPRNTRCEFRSSVHPKTRRFELTSMDEVLAASHCQKTFRKEPVDAFAPSSAP